MIKTEDVKKRILKAATTLYNACNQISDEGKCKQCPFDVMCGCELNGHPINWEKKLNEAKQSK